MGKEYLKPHPERRACRSEAQRGEDKIDAARAAGLPNVSIFVSGADVDAAKAAFCWRFDEPLPRTETLIAVMSVGYRMAIRDRAKGGS